MSTVPKVLCMNHRKVQPTTVISAIVAIINSSSSTSWAIWNAGRFVPAMFEVHTIGGACLIPSSSAVVGLALVADICVPMLL